MKKKFIKFFTINNRLSGYTYIELLIVISILVVFFLIGTASYRGFQRRKLLESNVRKFVADLRLVQEKALSGKNPDFNCDFHFLGITEKFSLKGYAIRLKESPASYLITPVCRSDNAILGRHVIRSCFCTVPFPGNDVCISQTEICEPTSGAIPLTGIAVSGFITRLDIMFPILGKGVYRGVYVNPSALIVIPAITFRLTPENIDKIINISLSGSISVQ